MLWLRYLKCKSIIFWPVEFSHRLENIVVYKEGLLLFELSRRHCVLEVASDVSGFIKRWSTEARSDFLEVFKVIDWFSQWSADRSISPTFQSRWLIAVHTRLAKKLRLDCTVDWLNHSFKTLNSLLNIPLIDFLFFQRSSPFEFEVRFEYTSAKWYFKLR